MTVFPLTAIVGQDELIEALEINCVAPDVGGVLVRGERGNAKTTAVRALAALLAPAPLVEVPLGATLDRLVGSLDLRGALGGAHRFEQGLLGRANGGILYVDEINLLADHLVDAMLDAAATGVARVEREAVSEVHDARFVLVGTMNAEEGELRPQLLDRFGLGVEVSTPEDPTVRAEIVRRRLAFERDPQVFADQFADSEHELAERIAAARRLLGDVILPERELQRITRACAELGVDGVRGDIVTARAARALAALDGSPEVGETHVRRAAVLALAHRRRRDPLSGHQPDPGDVQRALDSPEDEPDPDFDPTAPNTPSSVRHFPPGPVEIGGNGGPEPRPEGEWRANERVSTERVDAPVQAALPRLALQLGGRGRGPAGRRARSAGTGAGAIDSRPADDDSTDLALASTVLHRALAGRDDLLREHVRGGRESALLVIVIDASGSMGARRRAARVKGAVLEVLRDAYARRDRVALIAFRDAAAEVVVRPGTPIEQAASVIQALPTGGLSPLASGLRCATQLIERERIAGSGRRSVALVLTDGRVADHDGKIARIAARLGRVADSVSVIDTEDGPVRVGIAAQIAQAAGGTVHPLVEPTFRRAA